MATPRKPPSQHKVACVICRHPERHRIETLRIAGTEVTDALCTRFGVKRDAIYRHMANHVTPDAKAQIIADVPLRELADKAANEGVSLLDYLSLIRRTVVGKMLEAASINDHSGTAKLAGRALEVLQEIGRLTGELLAAAPVQNITNNYTAIMTSPAFREVEQTLIECLAPYPDALAAVLKGLERLELRGAPLKSLPMVEGTLAA